MVRTQQLFALVLSVVALTIPAFSQTTPSADCATYASIPLPPEAATVAVPKTPPSCASYRSYRGIDRPQNYAEARTCAWKERLAQQANLGQNPKEPTAWVVGGSLMLADIYFNGTGVKRNVPLALRFACESEEATVEAALADIAKLGPQLHKRFEFCDYAESTIQMNFCDSYESQVDADRRQRYYQSLARAMSPVQRAAFKNLLAAKQKYISTHDLEVDQGGTIRAIRTIGSEGILEDRFRTELIHFERGQWAAPSTLQIVTVDSLLSSEYKKKLAILRKQTQNDIDLGAVTADNLSKVEPVWEAYREAWISFAQLRYPSKVDDVRAEITFSRYRFLKTIESYESP